MCKVLYIAGYGRSGSTLLDVLLGAHDRAVSVGELVYLGREWRHEERTCACGAAYDQCPFWGSALSDTDGAAELIRLARQVEYRRALPRLLTGSLSDHVQRAYRHRMRPLFSYVAERGDAEWVVDSSKSGRHAAGRFWALRKVAGLDVRVVHLVRDGRDVLRSVVEKGTNWAAEGYRDGNPLRAEQTLVGWGLANSLAWAFGMALDGDRYLRVRFEDLLDNPESVLREVGNFIGEDFTSIIDRVAVDQSFPVGHNVSGNRIRRKQRLRLHRRAKEQRRPWAGLSTYHQVLFALLGQWLNLSFGYAW